MKRLTLRIVNQKLKELGYNEILCRGNGYFFFAEGDSSIWPMSGVYGVNNINDLSLEQWIEEHKNLKNSALLCR
jgi:hypothetical protein